MKFADGTYVDLSALDNNQIRVTASIQSYVKDLDGYDFAAGEGFDGVDETIAILYTQSSGILRIRASNIRDVLTRPELKTKIILTVYIKKAGFKNTETVVSGTTLDSLITPL
jgi:hypothetical protein